MKTFFLLAALAVVSQSVVAQPHGVVGNSASPHMRVKSIGLGECRWTGGFWGGKVDQCMETMIPHLGTIMRDPQTAHAYDNFLVAAGLKDGMFKGQPFHDGDFYKYVEALAYAYALTGDEAIDREMDEIIEVIGKAQRDDGYLHTKIQIGHGIQGFPRRNNERTFDVQPFSEGVEHEFYNFGHLMTAACIHYRATGKRSFLDIAVKASDLICETYKEPTPKLARVDWNPPHYMGLVEMYRTTGKKRYLDLAHIFVDMLGTAEAMKGDGRGMDHSQRRTPIREECCAEGHAGHGNYLYCGVVDLYAETGEQALWDAMERIWSDVAKKKMYVTGATGQNHYGISRNKDYVSEAYGGAYDLPGLSAYNETCANIGNAMWNWRMFLVGGESRFMDIAELVFYNSALSGISLDGKHYFYTNPLRFIQDHPLRTKDNGIRQDFMPIFCCPPNIVRTIAQMATYAYATSDEGLWVNLYGSNELNTTLADGTAVRLVQTSDYPWKGRVEFRVEPAVEKQFSLMLRIPGWADGVQVEVNGERVFGPVKAGTYWPLKRTWKAGDVAVLELPMEPQLVQAHPNIESTLGQAAVCRGPVVYCIESAYLPAGVGVCDVRIPQDARFVPRFEPELLGGVVVLEAQVNAVTQGDWRGSLYRPLPSAPAKSFDLRLIPYYSWSNRGKTDMTVWMPVAE